MIILRTAQIGSLSWHCLHSSRARGEKRRSGSCQLLPGKRTDKDCTERLFSGQSERKKSLGGEIAR